MKGESPKQTYAAHIFDTESEVGTPRQSCSLLLCNMINYIRCSKEQGKSDEGNKGNENKKDEKEQGNDGKIEKKSDEKKQGNEEEAKKEDKKEQWSSDKAP